jgi:hypothetical protein
MRAGLLPALLAALATAALPHAPARANIYTWIDAKGLVNVSNLPPPEGVRVIRDTPEPPRDPARDAAAREAARQAELQVLQGQVIELQSALEQTRREAAAPVAAPSTTVIVYPPPAPVQYSEPTPWPQVEYAAAPFVPGCDFGFNCGFWGGAYPGVVVVGVPTVRYPAHHRHGPRRDLHSGMRYPFALPPLRAAPALALR